MSRTRNDIVPALIDPPGPFDSLEEWLAYRASLAESFGDHLAIDPFLREADLHIARLRAIPDPNPTMTAADRERLNKMSPGHRRLIVSVMEHHQTLTFDEAIEALEFFGGL